MMRAEQKVKRGVSPFYLIHGMWHGRMLALYMVLVVVHGIEHIMQVYQAFVLGWLRSESGGALGLWMPQLAMSEVLHFSYNLFQLLGLLILRGGFKGRARRWWNIAIVFQTWHFFEHVLLQWQWLSGVYLFGKPQQVSLLELFIPRIELHFIYNMIVVLPTLIAVTLYIMERRQARQHA